MHVYIGRSRSAAGLKSLSHQGLPLNVPVYVEGAGPQQDWKAFPTRGCSLMCVFTWKEPVRSRIGKSFPPRRAGEGGGQDTREGGGLPLNVHVYMEGAGRQQDWKAFPTKSCPLMCLFTWKEPVRSRTGKHFPRGRGGRIHGRGRTHGRGGGLPLNVHVYMEGAGRRQDWKAFPTKGCPLMCVFTWKEPEPVRSRIGKHFPPTKPPGWSP